MARMRGNPQKERMGAKTQTQAKLLQKNTECFGNSRKGRNTGVLCRQAKATRAPQVDTNDVCMDFLKGKCHRPQFRAVPASWMLEGFGAKQVIRQAASSAPK